MKYLLNFLILAPVLGLSNASLGDSPTADPCRPGMIQAGPDPQTSRSYSSLKKAVEAAQSGWTITVGKGDYRDEAELKHKKNLILRGLCYPVLQGLTINHSQNIEVQGFRIVGREESAIEIGEESSGNSNITLRNNQITNVKGAGITIGKKNRNITLDANEIIDNKTYGITAEREIVGDFNVHNNRIENNGSTGIYLTQKGRKKKLDRIRQNKDSASADYLEYNFKDNIIYNNGTSSKGGYGIDFVFEDVKFEPDAVTLKNNYITGNHGKVEVGKSSGDLGHFPLYLDSTDSANITTGGSEGFGVILDNCPLVRNPDQKDSFHSGKGDACNPDIDGDTIANTVDNCPFNPNPAQEDLDHDGLGDACDLDRDNDLVLNESDNCPDIANPDQKDSFHSGKGDACNPDIDGDTIANTIDNCPLAPNPLQEDMDHDGIGDVCDADRDNDLVLNEFDNCPDTANPDQKDSFHSGKGDVCNPDIDGDTIANTVDNCPLIPNPGQENIDGDALGDACDADRDNDLVLNEFDNCPDTANPDQKDSFHSGKGDACNPDIDGDTIANTVDNCPLIPNPLQENADGDAFGDACDADRDNDLVLNEFDNCPDIANPDQKDSFQSGKGDACNPDIDGDAVANEVDNCPLLPNPNQEDSDHNGRGDVCDPSFDTDHDGILSATDNCPLVPNADQKDFDEDGQGDACDSFTSPVLAKFSPIGTKYTQIDLTGIPEPYKVADMPSILTLAISEGRHQTSAVIFDANPSKEIADRPLTYQWVIKNQSNTMSQNISKRRFVMMLAPDSYHVELIVSNGSYSSTVASEDFTVNHVDLAAKIGSSLQLNGVEASSLTIQNDHLVATFNASSLQDALINGKQIFRLRGSLTGNKHITVIK